MTGDYVVIDGSFGEGGGQILRTTLALAAVLRKKVKIINIRARRPRPGLQRQHLTAVRAMAELCRARVRGAELGSTSLIFEPGELRSGKFVFDIGTAGSVTLVLQALLPVVIFAPGPVVVEIRGGTDVPWSPPVDYVRFVLRRLLARMGLEFELIVRRRGHYPRGGGHVVLSVEKPPGELKGLGSFVERGEIKYIEGLSHCVRLPSHVAKRQAEAAAKELRTSLPNVPVHIDLEYYEPSRDPHLGPGSGIVLWAIASHSILGGDALGAKGKPAEEVGLEAARKLVEDLKTGKALDRHASDMIIPFAALARGTSVVGGAKLTLHAYTNIEIVKKLVPEAELVVKEGELGRPFVLEVRGVGMTL